MRILVTGGMGFIGGHVARRLLERGYEVGVLDSLERSSRTIADMLSRYRYRLYIEDLRYSDRIGDIVREYDIVIHAAAYIDVEESVRDPWSYIENNYVATYRLSRYLERRQRMIYISSAAVYGEAGEVPVREDSPKRPLSPYGLSKLLGEDAVVYNSLCRGYRYTILRLFNVYGPGQSRSYAGVVTVFIDRVLRGLPPVIYGDGSNTRDFVYIDDVVEVVVRVVEREDLVGVYNVGTGRGVSVRELAEIVIGSVGARGLRPVYTDPRPGDIRVSIADITRLERDLGFTPRTDIREGVREMILYLRNYMDGSREENTRGGF